MTVTACNPQQIIRLLLAASANVSLYGPQHPQVVRLLAQLCSQLESVLESAEELSFMMVDNELVINHQPQDACLFLSRIVELFKARGIEHLGISRGITPPEVEELVQALSTRPGTDGQLASSEHVRFGRLELRLDENEADGCGEVAGSPEALLPKLSEQELEQFNEIYRAVKRHQKLRLGGVVEMVNNLVDVLRQESLPLLVLATLRESDEYTFTHSTNVCILNLAQAAALGIKGQQLKDIGIAAMLHDIGKLFIPEEIITKPGALTDAEFKLMQEHPVRGARYLMEQTGAPRIAAIAAYEHHAKFDLTGYPSFTPGWRLNLGSHLTMISDFFDATRTRRSYREPLPLDQIMNLMGSLAGSHLHPDLTRNFFQLLQPLTRS
ncbi:HD family phosphohydrolase [Geomonas limicola]|uniref:HD family phosphohydrolase n=1 Tax=Geomonas limicola TaxID=2740186 RepID=A0A6V8N9V0_9BACT|nr:HD domain-containing phosphohydrolase [Geomonas limicola]GFO69348.1 HD family phosphohydrolase [Geomonas limicola]